jgi:aldose 1-epimerase
MPTCWAGPDISPSFQTFKKLAASDLDNCFTGFGGEAVIRWPNRPDVRILSQGCNFLQVYTRGEDGSFCVEAQTAMPDGINRIGNPNAGIVIVEPGQTFGCDTHFVVASAA